VFKEASQSVTNIMQILLVPIGDGINSGVKKNKKRRKATYFWEPPREQREKICGRCLGELGIFQRLDGALSL
jgi:hypothetical protein